jgi:hypothetical protein
MNLFLALAWLSLGITVLVWQAFSGNQSWYLPLGEYRISYGYIMFLLVAFNLNRWWNLRSARWQRRQQQIEVALRQRDPHRQARQEPPNPELNFSDDAPSPPENSGGTP